MIICLIGTRAQLIKMAPVILEMRQRGLPIQIVFTGQHKATMESLLLDFNIKGPFHYLYDGPEISGYQQVLTWFIKCLYRGLKYLRQQKKVCSKNIILVHGDTFSTLLGAILGKLSGQRVVHIESGLRSYNWLEPFPEELTRLIVFSLSDIAFCPGTWAYQNLDRYKVVRVNTEGNTLIDALRIAEKNPVTLSYTHPEHPFGVVSLHRFENVFNRKRLGQIIELLEAVACVYPLVFVLHPATEKNLKKFDLFHRIARNPRIERWPRVGYCEFITLLGKAKFVITDGGGNQEELSYMRKPTLLMRGATERQEGLGQNVFLCEYKQERMQEFLNYLDELSVSGQSRPTIFPSKIIVNHLVEMSLT